RLRSGLDDQVGGGGEQLGPAALHSRIRRGGCRHRNDTIPSRFVTCTDHSTPTRKRAPVTLSVPPGAGPDTGIVLDAGRKRSILVALCLSLMAVIASVSILNVAQQDLAIQFDAAQSTVLWIINVYTLALAALLMPIGAIGDRWGRKPVLLAGLALFGVSSIIAALANSADMMIVGRALAGVAAAMIMPVTLS